MTQRTVEVKLTNDFPETLPAKFVDVLKLQCSACGVIIGQLIWVENHVWLHLETGDAQYFHGRCGTCQKIVHFDSRDYQLARLIERVKRARITAVE